MFHVKHLDGGKMNTANIMPRSSPDTTIVLYRMPSAINNKYEHTVFFESEDEQKVWMNSLQRRTFDRCTWVKNDTIKLNIDYDSAKMYTYLSYTRKSYFKPYTYYCFVTSIQYVNESTTLFNIELDLIQTYMLQIQWRDSLYVAKSHENEYGVSYSNNTYPEDFEIGEDYEIVDDRILYETEYDNNFLIASAADLVKSGGTVSNPVLKSSTGGELDGMPSMLTYYIANGSELATILETLTDFPWVSQNIQFISVIPDMFVDSSQITKKTSEMGFSIRQLNNGYTSPDVDDVVIPNFRNSFKRYYQTTNLKLYNYPYCVIVLTNMAGSECIIKPQYIKSDNLTLSIQSYIGVNGRMAIYPKNYLANTTVSNRDSGYYLGNSLIQGNFPTVQCLTDNYILYQAQNANSFRLTEQLANLSKVEGLVKGGASLVSGLFSGHPFAGLASGVSNVYEGYKSAEISIARQNSKISDMSITPPTLTGQSGGDSFLIANNESRIRLQWKMCRREYCKRVDDSYKMYGYVRNQFLNMYDVIHSKKTWNYIRLVAPDVKITNCQSDISDRINSILENGITFWFTESYNVGNYNQINENRS